jgi:hypothetical protein
MSTADKVIQWSPRIICILAILLVSMFAFDVFSPTLTIWQEILALLVHLIPSFVLLGILIIAWKWEKIGGIILIIIGIIFLIWVFYINYWLRHFTLLQSIINVSLLCLPFIIAGVLFIVSYKRKLKR